MHFSVQYVVFLERENCDAARVIGLVSVPDSTMQSECCARDRNVVKYLQHLLMVSTKKKLAFSSGDQEKQNHLMN